MASEGRPGSFLKGLEGLTVIPQEKMMRVEEEKQTLRIGLPREVLEEEKRVALSPDGVEVLVNNGHEVVAESKAGEDSRFSDKDYSEVGARIVFSAEEVYKNSNTIVKVAPPLPDEIDMMHDGQLLVSAVHIGSLKAEYLKKLMKKNITALGFEFIRDRHNALPIVRMMSEIAGIASVLIAGEYLSATSKGVGLLLGGISGIPPANVVILGAGTVGEFAARAALGLGAQIKVLDTSIYKLRRLETLLGVRIYTAVAQFNYIEDALKDADVAIGAVLSQGGRTPCMVTDEMVQKMKEGSIIIDVSIDQGGCFETSRVTSHENPTFVKHGVIHYCVPNIPSKVPRTASFAMSNVLTKILVEMGEAGSMQEMFWANKGVRTGVYVFKNKLTQKSLAMMFGMDYQDIDLLVAAHM